MHVKKGQSPTRKQEFLNLLKSDPSECWIWPHADNGYGYGRIRWGSTRYGDGPGKIMLAHRLAYELFIGPIPDGKPLDHTCHTNDPTCMGRGGCIHRLCVNPAHLEPVTTRENHARQKCHGPEPRRQ